MAEKNAEMAAKTRDKWNLVAQDVLQKGQTHENKLLHVIDEKQIENAKHERINQAFTYGIKL